MAGLFVAFEGGEGVGKSTQIALAAAWAREQGRTVVETREPGGTPLGVELRRLVLDPDGHVTPRAEALLYAADRAHHVDTVVLPALERGDVVLTDRYVDSTFAYQGAGRGLDARAVTAWATGGLVPHLTVLLDLDPSVGLVRAGARSRPDRLEGASAQFHETVRAGFLALAAAEPARYVVLDAARPADAIAADVRAALAPCSPERGPLGVKRYATMAGVAADEVDGIVAAWHRERPDLDVDPLQVMSRLDRLADVLAERRGHVFANHGLRRHEFDVLVALRRDGEPFALTAGELSARTYVTSGTMTSRLDGLTERGLVVRAPDAGDGRLVRVTLTAAGRRIVDAAFEELLEAERELLAPLPPETVAPLAAALRALLARATAP